jgi:membrane protein
VYWNALRSWQGDNMQRAGASLAYSTLFAIAPMILVAVAVAGLVFDESSVRARITREIQHLIGLEGSLAVEGLLRGALQRKAGIIASAIGTVTFVLASTGAFLELQNTLNEIWRVPPRKGGFMSGFLLSRTLSFALVVASGFLLLVSLVMSAILAALSDWMESAAPVHPLFWRMANIVVAGAVITLLFAFLFKFLPDVKIRWRDVFRGAIATALLFSVGKELIGLYLGQSAVASSYGAAGSVLVLLLWVYYTSQIVLYGAELTRAYALRDGAVPGEVASAPTTHQEAA